MKWSGLLLLWVCVLWVYNVARWGLVYGAAVLVGAVIFTAVALYCYALVRFRFTKKTAGRHLR